MLLGAIEELEEKERHLLDLYYLEEMTMKRVGVILSIGESRVSQIHTVAIRKLRGRMRAKIHGEPAADPGRGAQRKAGSTGPHRQVGR
jgi:DNA-directed RNA polymerase sigma subunit (sigma70/sigma32)